MNNMPPYAKKLQYKAIFSLKQRVTVAEPPVKNSVFLSPKYQYI